MAINNTWIDGIAGVWSADGTPWSLGHAPALGEDVSITTASSSLSAYTVLLFSETPAIASLTIGNATGVTLLMTNGILIDTGIVDLTEIGTLLLASGSTINATNITLETASDLLEGDGIVTGTLSGSGTVLANGGGDLRLETAIGNLTGLHFTIGNVGNNVLQVDASIGAGNTFTFQQFDPSFSQTFAYNNTAPIKEKIVGLNVGSSATTPTNFIDFRNQIVTIISGGQGSGASGLVSLSGGSALVLSGITGVPGSWLVDAVSDGAGGTKVFLSSAVCYARGTHILTPTGEKFVEDLNIGDLVVTRFNGIQPIRWIGRQSYDSRFITANRDRLPVHIHASALGDRLPARDLYISPGHSMLVDGQLVLAWSLVNGVTITQDWSATEIHYFQIELETHDCVIAEGAWSETYADGPGLRERFHNAAQFAALYPDHAPPDELSLCAPRPERGAKLDALLRPVVARASSALKPGPLRGYIDRIEAPWTINGWANDADHPELPVLLEVLLDDRVIGTVLACDYRADLAEAGIGQGRCAFFMKSPVRLRPEALATIRIRRAADHCEIAMSSDCAAAIEAGGEPPRASGLRLIA